jgi:hypothetical protein
MEGSPTRDDADFAKAAAAAGAPGLPVPRPRQPDRPRQGAAERGLHPHAEDGGLPITFYFKNYVGSARSGRVVLFDEVDYQRADPATLARAARARYVSGHLSWAAFETIRRPDTYVFTFMRDPVERLLSLYYYFKAFPYPTAEGERVRELARRPVEEFFAIDDPAIRFYTENFVVRQFAGATADMPRGEDLAAAIGRARAHLELLDLIGFVDSFDRDFRAIVQSCGLPAPRQVPKHNVTAFTNPADREERERRRHSPELLRVLEPLIAGDRALYDHFAARRGGGPNGSD